MTTLQKPLSPAQEAMVSAACAELAIDRARLVEEALRYFMLHKLAFSFPRSETRGGNRQTPYARGLYYARRALDAGDNPATIEADAKLLSQTTENEHEFMIGVYDEIKSRLGKSF